MNTACTKSRIGRYPPRSISIGKSLAFRDQLVRGFCSGLRKGCDGDRGGSRRSASRSCTYYILSRVKALSSIESTKLGWKALTGSLLILEDLLILVYHYEMRWLVC